MLEKDLFIYLAIFYQKVSVVLVWEEEGVQKLIFYVSKVLKGAKLRYIDIEKAALVLFLVFRKFEVHLKNYQRIMVTNQPLRHIL